MKDFRLGNSVPSIIKDPFSKIHIKNIHMHMIHGPITDKVTFTGSVEFKNGNTEGKQSFKADSFDGLYIKIANFVKTV